MANTLLTRRLANPLGEQIIGAGAGKPHKFRHTMKKLFLKFALAAGLALAIGSHSQAADDNAKVKTIKGTAVCAKCELHKTSSCQNAIKTKEDGKEVVYYLEQNDVSKKFHKNVCQSPEKVVATGTVKKEDGKVILVAKTIKLAEDKK